LEVTRPCHAEERGRCDGTIGYLQSCDMGIAMTYDPIFFKNADTTMHHSNHQKQAQPPGLTASTVIPGYPPTAYEPAHGRQ